MDQLGGTKSHRAATMYNIFAGMGYCSKLCNDYGMLYSVVFIVTPCAIV